MEGIEELIERALGSDEAAVSAARQLVARGAAAVVPAAGAIRGRKAGLGALKEVLPAIRDPSAVPVLVGLLDDRDGGVFFQTVRALGRSGDPTLATR